MQNKSFSTYYQAITDCLSTHNHNILFVCNNDAYFKNVMTFLKMFNVGYVLNPNSSYIKFYNGSKIHFSTNETIPKQNFNMIVISEN